MILHDTWIPYPLFLQESYTLFFLKKKTKQNKKKQEKEKEKEKQEKKPLYIIFFKKIYLKPCQKS